MVKIKYYIMKLQLEKLKVKKSLTSDEVMEMEARKEIANGIYQQGTGGLADAALAVKMWNGDDNTDYTEEEADAILQFTAKHYVPAVIIAVQDVINAAKDGKKK